MRLENISPWLRSAIEVSFKPADVYFRAPDHRIYYILSENCSVEVNGKRYGASPHSILLIPPDSRYRFYPEQDFRALVVNFDYDRTYSSVDTAFGQVREEAFSPSMLTGECSFEEHIELNDVVYLENCYVLRDSFLKIIEEFSFKKQLYTEVCSLLLKEVIIRLVRRIDSFSDSEEKIDELLDYVNENCHLDLKNTDLAAMVGYHPYHLNRIMRRATGTTLHQYLLSCRISRAMRYLTETSLKVGEICRLCGYSDISNFSVDFKRRVGLSPVDFRSGAGMADK